MQYFSSFVVFGTMSSISSTSPTGMRRWSLVSFSFYFSWRMSLMIFLSYVLVPYFLSTGPESTVFFVICASRGVRSNSFEASDSTWQLSSFNSSSIRSILSCSRTNNSLLWFYSDFSSDCFILGGESVINFLENRSNMVTWLLSSYVEIFLSRLRNVVSSSWLKCSPN